MDGFSVTSKNFDRMMNNDMKSLKIESNTPANSLVEKSNPGSGNVTFADTLKNAISEVNQLHKVSDKAAQDVATGRSNSVSEAMISSERADIAFRTMVTVRNKIIDAYQEIMRMQV